MNWTELNSTQLNWNELNWTEVNWLALKWTELNWIQLNWSELNWGETATRRPGKSAEPNDSWLNWTELKGDRKGTIRRLKRGPKRDPFCSKNDPCTGKTSLREKFLRPNALFLNKPYARRILFLRNTVITVAFGHVFTPAQWGPFGQLLGGS